MLNWLSSFQAPLYTILTNPWTPWLILSVIAVSWVLSATNIKSIEAPLQKVKAPFGAEKIPNPIFLLAATLWSLLLLILLGGLIGFIIDIIAHSLPSKATPTEDRQFYTLITKTGALTAVLGAVVALPFTVIRLKLTTEQTRHNENVLYNDKLHEANNDLHAQRQVSVFVKDDDGNETTQRETIWEDDIIRRNGAIDRLEALVIEDPSFAPRIARMLCVYLTEMTRDYPAEKCPDDLMPDKIRSWARRLTVKRSDMEVAAQVLGRLHDKTGVAPKDLAIDLSEVNLQAMRLSKLNFEQAAMNNTNLDGAELSWASLNGAILNGAKLNRAKLNRAELNGAILNRAVLNRAELNGAVLNGAILYGAELNGAVLYEAELYEAELYEAKLNGAKLNGAKLYEAKLYEAELNGAKLNGAALNGAILNRAKLYGAVLNGATDLRAVHATGSALRSTSLEAVKNLDSLLKDSFGDASVTLPTDVERPAHWPDAILNYHKFLDEWELFKKDPDAYVPPQHRTKS